MARSFVLKRDDARALPQLSIDYAGSLNAQQYAAATVGGGPVLVVAGAGTGKTRTLVYRVAYLVETGTMPERITLLTFTRRAAREMLGRAATLLDGRCERVQGGTFHAFCAQVLRRHAPRIGYPENFTILDSSDSADVIDVLRTQHGLHQSSRRFPRKKALQSLFSAVRNSGGDLESVVMERAPQFAPHLDALVELFGDYARYKKARGLMDYDDLLLLTIVLFHAHPDVEKAVAAMAQHVLVDEYQDTNAAQALLVERFASVHGNVMAVGDDAQSIYRFRGADVGNILHFPDRFPGAQVLKLEENYRSTQPVLDLANHILERAAHKYDKHLFTTRSGGEKPAVVAAQDDRTEARFVAQAILQFREENTPLNRMAVLFRSAFNSYELEVELSRRGIPFVKFGGMKLAEAAHIKDVLAHLKVAENPRDAPAWNRILQLLPGVGPKTAQSLIEWITTGEGEPFVVAEGSRLSRYADRLRGLFELLRAIAPAQTALPAQVEAVLAYFEPICKEKYFEDFPKRLQDLEHFAGIAEGYPSRAAFLESLALDPIELTALGSEALDEDEPPLILSTIHSAKGLEFDTVFVIQALDGVLPSGYSLNDPDDIEEELRLLYVAVTRAETNLFISYPILRYRRYQGEAFTRVSRFLDGIPDAVLEPMQLVEEPTAPPTAVLPAPKKALSAPPSPALDDDLRDRDAKANLPF